VGFRRISRVSRGPRLAWPTRLSRIPRLVGFTRISRLARKARVSRYRRPTRLARLVGISRIPRNFARIILFRMF
jgi:hypothetical protein